MISRAAELDALAQQKEGSERAGGGSRYDTVLLHVAREFHMLDARLDEFTAHEEQASDAAFLAVHREWLGACSRAAALPAATIEGRKAKARILLIVLNVISPNADQRQAHELLAASLARDLLE